MEFYEIIIIGAGPGGLACARKLASGGKKVLLLEKNQVIGPKVCAGGLTKGGFEYLKLPGELLECKFQEISIHASRQSRSIVYGEDFIYTVDRKSLGEWQLGKIPKNNVRIRIGSRVTAIGRDRVVVNGSEKIGFKYLVGADGSSSMVRNFLKVETRNLIMAFQYLVPGEDYRKLEIFFDWKLFGLGYAWIFPHRGYASIGCGGITRLITSKSLREGFDQWLKMKKIDVSRGRFEAFPINFDYRGYRFGNIFLVGDAAGLASALTGGGIGQAVVSGEEVAEMIMNKNHIPLKIQEILDKKKTQEKVVGFFEKSGTLARMEIELFAFLLKYGWSTRILTKLVL